MSNVVAIAPTVERVRQAKFGVEAPSVDQKVNRPYARVKDIWQQMRERSQISEQEENAGRKFASDYEAAFKGRKITPSYGTGQAEGTPISQQATAAAENDAARWVDRYKLHRDAMECLPETGQTAMKMATQGNTLEQVGKWLFGYSDPKRAQASGATAIRMSLAVLVIHYERPRLKVPR